MVLNFHIRKQSGKVQAHEVRGFAFEFPVQLIDQFKSINPSNQISLHEVSQSKLKDERKRGLFEKRFK